MVAPVETWSPDSSHGAGGVASIWWGGPGSSSPCWWSSPCRPCPRRSGTRGT